MRAIILGSNKQAIGIAKVCMSIADAILFFDPNPSSLTNARNVVEEYIKEINILTPILEYSTNLSKESTEKSIVFDCISEQVDDHDFLKYLFREASLRATIFFTSSKFHSVTYLASLTDEPKRVVGLQVLNSIEDTKIVELIKGIQTSQSVLGTAQKFINELGKEAIVLKDSPGFLFNRLVLVLINEAIHLLNDGIGTPKDIDREMELNLGMKIGPLKLADKIGLDHVLKILNQLYEETGNSKFLPNPLLKNMVNAGYLGVETNSGFFNYSAEILNFPYLGNVD